MLNDPRGWSDIAQRVARPRDVKARPIAAPEALVVHTTGRGIYAASKKVGVTPLAWVLSEYQAPDQNFAHYVIDLEGVIWQIANDTAAAWHCRVTAQEREAYRNGSWRATVSAAGLALWEAAHGPDRNPTTLIASGRSPNLATVGVELVPLRTPDLSGSLFTDEQYQAVRALRADLGARWLNNDLTLSSGLNIPVFGHEDLSPLTRWDSRGGWDPGARRARPWFDWSRVT